MFSFLRRQKKDAPKEENKISNKDGEEEKMEKRIGEEIAIHTMPERFRLNSLKANKAKTTGVFLMVGGFIFIIAMAVLLYFFIFKAPGEKQVAPSPESKVYTSESESKAEVPPGSQAGAPEEGTEEEIGEVPRVVTEEDYLEGLGETATSTPGEETEPQATSTPAEGIVLEDGDGDGLSSKEEALLGTNDGNVDSDGDTYSDYQELMNLYNPAGAGKLIDNPNIGQYTNRTFGYSVTYPVNWARTSIGGDDSIMFKSEDNQFIQVIVQPNAERENIREWYERQFSNGTVSPEQEITGNDWRGIKSEDGLIVYLIDSNYNYIFVLSYNAGPGSALSYKNIFNMMVKSLEIGE